MCESLGHLGEILGNDYEFSQDELNKIYDGCTYYLRGKNYLHFGSKTIGWKYSPPYLVPDDKLGLVVRESVSCRCNLRFGHFPIRCVCTIPKVYYEIPKDLYKYAQTLLGYDTLSCDSLGEDFRSLLVRYLQTRLAGINPVDSPDMSVRLARRLALSKAKEIEEIETKKEQKLLSIVLFEEVHPSSLDSELMIFVNADGRKEYNHLPWKIVGTVCDFLRKDWTVGDLSPDRSSELNSDIYFYLPPSLNDVYGEIISNAARKKYNYNRACEDMDRYDRSCSGIGSSYYGDSGDDTYGQELWDAITDSEESLSNCLKDFFDIVPNIIRSGKAWNRRKHAISWYYNQIE